MNAATQVRGGALLAGLAVALGAFGAHALEERLATRGYTETWDTAVLYQLAHGLALLLCGVLTRQGQRTVGAAWCFLLGSVVFSGTLYVLAAVGPRWLGAITPIGGVLMIVGWAALALGGPRAQE